MTHISVFVFVIHFKEMILSRNTTSHFQNDKEHASFQEKFLQLLTIPQTVAIPEVGFLFPTSTAKQSPKTNKEPEHFYRQQNIS